MARRRRHEEHANHEAWAIPYGDLITLLLAFFVVMYAISSVNVGKYRVLSDTLNQAFGGPPTRINPITVGRATQQERDPPTIVRSAQGPTTAAPIRPITNLPRLSRQLRNALPQPMVAADRHDVMRASDQLADVSRDVEAALGSLIQRDLVNIKRNDLWIEVAIKSDILFASGSAVPSPQAVEVMTSLADALRDAPNAVRIEGHTDNRPISTLTYPSNWELSSARAASVVRLLQQRGVAGERLSLIGYGEQRPIADNGTPQGRNANRRVVVVILADIADNLPRQLGAAPSGGP